MKAMIRTVVCILSEMESSEGFVTGVVRRDLCIKKTVEYRWPNIQVGISLAGHCNNPGEKTW